MSDATPTGLPAAAPASPAAAPAPAAKPAPPVPGAPKPVISFDDFAKLDLRVARILACVPHPNADKLWKLSVDDGSGTPRQLCAGIKEYYTPEQLVGRSIIIVANLAPRNLRGEESRGMLLAASNVPKESAGPAVARSVILLRPDADIAPGAIVS